MNALPKRDPYGGGRYLLAVENLRDGRLRAIDRQVLTILGGHANFKDFHAKIIGMSNKRLASATGRSLTSVKESTTRLTDCGYLIKEAQYWNDGQGRKENAYYLTNKVFRDALESDFGSEPSAIDFSKIYKTAYDLIGIFTTKAQQKKFEQTALIAGISEDEIIDLLEKLAATPYLKSSTTSIERIWHIHAAEQQDRRIKNRILAIIQNEHGDELSIARDIAKKQGWGCSDGELEQWLGLDQYKTHQEDSSSVRSEGKPIPAASTEVSSLNPENQDQKETDRSKESQLISTIVDMNQPDYSSRLRDTLVKTAREKGGLPLLRSVTEMFVGINDPKTLEDGIKRLGGQLPKAENTFSLHSIIDGGGRPWTT